MTTQETAWVGKLYLDAYFWRVTLPPTSTGTGGRKVTLAGKTYGTVQVHEEVLRTAITVALSGTVTASRLPALVFVFERDQEAAAVQRWVQARALRSGLPVTQLSIVDAQQTAELCFVCVAWNPDTSDQPGAMPSKLAHLVAWLEDTNRDDLGVRVTDVLKALEQLEPRAVARTMVLDPTRAGLSQPDQPHAVGTPLQTAPAAIRTTAILPSSSHMRATSILPTTHPRRTTTLSGSPVELADEPPTETQKPTRRWVAVGLCTGAVAAALITLVLPRLKTAPPPIAAVAPEPVKNLTPTQPPPQPVTPPVIAPQDVAAPEESVQEITIATRPSGATVCNPKTGEILGETPLNLPASRFRDGHKLLLTRAGYTFRSFRWPADHKMTLIRLGPDELQPFSPCR